MASADPAIKKKENKSSSNAIPRRTTEESLMTAMFVQKCNELKDFANTLVEMTNDKDVMESIERTSSYAEQNEFHEKINELSKFLKIPLPSLESEAETIIFFNNYVNATYELLNTVSMKNCISELLGDEANTKLSNILEELKGGKSGMLLP